MFRTTLALFPHGLMFIYLCPFTSSHLFLILVLSVLKKMVLKFVKN